MASKRKILVEHERLTRKFYRNVGSMELLKAFYEKFEAWKIFDVDDETNTEELFEQWEKINISNKGEITEELKKVNDIGRERGRYWLSQMAEHEKIENHKEMSLPRLALTLYISNSKTFNKAYELFIIEKKENLRIFKGVSIPPFEEPSELQLNHLKNSFKEVLYKNSFGKRLRLEKYYRDDQDKWLLVVPHEHYMKPDTEFDQKENLVSKERRPVVEILIIYYPAKGILKVKAGRGKKPEKAASLFAIHILNMDNDHFINTSIIRFAPLYDPQFSFPLDIKDGIEWVSLIELTFISGETQYTIRNDNKDVRDILSEHGLSDIEITKAKFLFKFPGGKRSKKTAEISIPNQTNLDETDRDKLIEDFLIRWGFIDVAIGDMEPLKKAECAIQGNF